MATFEQACRLWHLDATHCRAALERLVAERFLHQAHDGAYIALPATRGMPAKAALSSSRPPKARRSRST